MTESGPPRGATVRSSGLPLARHRLVRAGTFAWSLVGLFVVLGIIVYLLGMFRLVVVPLVIALFPAALLSPLARWLIDRRWPPAAAAATVLLGFLVSVLGLLASLVWLVAGEFDDLLDTLEAAYDDIAGWIADRTGWTPPAIAELVERVQDWAGGLDAGGTASSVAFATIEIVSAILLGIVALFFYLKDGPQLRAASLLVIPRRIRDEVDHVIGLVWDTIGGYFRGQILVAAVDAVFIGLGLLVLGVPLALPLALLVFFGGLFPIVGAFTAGAVAVLVALADGGVGLALAVLVLNIVVQQVEGNVLEPIIVGRATQLHPLAVIGALTAGAVTLGILGAFLAVPIAASIVCAARYVLSRDPELAVGGHDDGSGHDTGEPPEVTAVAPPGPPTPATGDG